ncbi:MAG TPA: hypothetical protein DGG94_01250 [Micromonosporaceae bacterium]|nr:hypothetical protein [Micromonosporaceae bacterium]HCU48455.1 hypothetical protein [Micromonosporaceae bacterium]
MDARVKKGTRAPITVTAVGTAAVVTRAPLRHPANRGRSVLGGSGLLTAASAVALGYPARLVCHHGRDPDGERIRSWGRENRVHLPPGRRDQSSVHLVQELCDGEGMIVAGTPDPGPTRSAIRTAVAEQSVLIIGDTGDQALASLGHLLGYRRRAGLATPSIVTANLSAAAVRSWPNACAVWGVANLVTIGERELDELGLDHSGARKFVREDAVLVVTAGAGPVSIYTPDGDDRALVPGIASAVDTMGAGDTYALALSVLLCKGADAIEAGHKAITAAQLMCHVDSVEGLAALSWAANEAGPDPPGSEDEP